MTAPDPRDLYCPRCRKYWHQSGNRTGHCSACHETFQGSTLFDNHLRHDAEGRVYCRNPRTMRVRDHELREVRGVWHTTEKRPPGSWGGTEKKT